MDPICTPYPAMGPIRADTGDLPPLDVRDPQGLFTWGHPV